MNIDWTKLAKKPPNDMLPFEFIGSRELPLIDIMGIKLCSIENGYACDAIIGDPWFVIHTDHIFAYINIITDGTVYFIVNCEANDCRLICNDTKNLPEWAAFNLDLADRDYIRREIIKYINRHANRDGSFLTK